MKAVVFLGGGSIAGALTAGLRLAGDRRKIVVYDRHPEKMRELQRESRVEIARDLRSAVEQAEMLIVAVRPRSVKGMLDEVAACGANPPKLCVSLAAGVPLRNLQRWLGPPARWVRAMPSPVCRIGHGLTALDFARRAAKGERQRVRRLFGRVGLALDIAERQFDAFTAAFSPSHGYHALATLAKAAQDAGLERAIALTAAAHALGDGILYWRVTGQRLDDLLREAATPGGTAAATISVMEESGYARTVVRGLRAGIQQAHKNGRL